MSIENTSFLEGLYAQYLRDPMTVDEAYRAYFKGFETSPSVNDQSEERIFTLIEAYRRFGHLAARVNPLTTKEIEIPKELNINNLGFSAQELKDTFPTFGIMEAKTARLEEIVARLRHLYCGSLGIEYRHIENVALEEWLQERIERRPFPPPFTQKQRQEILHHLTKATLFEYFLHTKYVGQKRFSLEGGETLIPMVHEVIERGATLGAQEYVVGMSHRGRLNVLTNILNKSYAMVFSEFEDYYDPALATGTGDVKYHKGFSAEIATESGKTVHVALTANPSHLESVNPIVVGKVRAKQDQRGDTERTDVIPILVHGDAALAGQGVVYETLQLMHLRGYKTGGTLHFVINNQIGFTTLPHDGRSTRYATDIAKAFSAPIFHVNSEDPEGCVYAALLALEIRQKFHIDVFIDMYCYRKFGHNEGDEPAFTQPIEYELIRKKRSLRELYRDQLIAEKVITPEEAEKLEAEFKKSLHEALESSQLQKYYPEEAPFQGIWEKYSKEPTQEVATAVSEKELREITEKFCTPPENINYHPKVRKLFQERQAMVEGKIDWAMGEYLALGSLLWEGAGVRLVGQDSRRGTFSQRHAVVVDQKNGEKYFPLQHLKEGQGKFEVYDSPLSEYAALGFEFGFSLSAPRWLVLWEAQYGDFANGGQIIIDQYLAASEEKWQRFSGLTLLLPHGYEGQGPEHSSARIERFLQLAGNQNMQIAYPTSAAQYFHLLRRQVVRAVRRPLVVFTPKSRLRHPSLASPLKEFTQGGFEGVLDDPLRPEKVRRVVVCTGKVFYTLSEAREQQGIKDVAIIRLEQLYPLEKQKLMKILQKYNAPEIFFVQEEPENMGPWWYIKAALPELPFIYAGRKGRAAPATAAHHTHVQEEQEFTRRALG